MLCGGQRPGRGYIPTERRRVYKPGPASTARIGRSRSEARSEARPQPARHPAATALSAPSTPVLVSGAPLTSRPSADASSPSTASPRPCSPRPRRARQPCRSADTSPGARRADGRPGSPRAPTATAGSTGRQPQPQSTAGRQSRPAYARGGRPLGGSTEGERCAPPRGQAPGCPRGQAPAFLPLVSAASQPVACWPSLYARLLRLGGEGWQGACPSGSMRRSGGRRLRCCPGRWRSSSLGWPGGRFPCRPGSRHAPSSRW